MFVNIALGLLALTTISYAQQCQDNYNWCYVIETYGSCHLDVTKRHCRLSCGHCSEPTPALFQPTEDCKDDRYDCEERFFVCPLYPEFAASCRMTCEHCRTGPVAPVQPVGPIGTVEPVATVQPVGPIGTVEPVATVQPVGPIGTVEPVTPVLPTEAPTTVVTVAPREACNNKLLDCNDVKQFGLCETEVGQKCEETCETCSDCEDTDECSELARQGLCEENASIKDDCQRSCGVCQ